MTNPLKILREATKAVPAVRYALGVSGLAGAIALIFSFGLSPKVALWGLIAMLFLMALLLVFARLSTLPQGHFLVPALIFLYTTVTLFAFTGIFFFTSVFFKWPVDLRYWIQDSKHSTQIQSPINKDSSEHYLNEALSRHISTSIIEFNGESIDYLLDSNSTSVLWNNFFDRPPLIITSLTSILDTLSWLKEQFNISPDFTTTKNLVKKNNQIKEKSFPRLKKYLAGTNPNISKTFSLYTEYDVLKDVGLSDKVNFTGDNALPLTSKGFETLSIEDGVVTGKDCDERCSSAFFRLYKYITRNLLPQNFIYVTHAPVDECGGECGDIGKYKYGEIIDFSTPVLKLGAYVLTNNNQQEVMVGGIDLLVNKAKILRTFEENDSSSKTRERHVTAIHLQPGQSIVIPAYVSFCPLTKVKDMEKTIDSRQWTKLRQGFAYGDIFKLDSIEINGMRFLPIRVPEKAVVAIAYKGFVYGNLGTCPYVYSVAPGVQNLYLEGTTITGNSNSDKKNWDTLQLKQFSGELEIQENDPEESYLDQILVARVDSSGHVTMYAPNDTNLEKLDHKYLHLRQGQKHRLKFDMPSKLPSDKFYLFAFGYYLPYRR